MQSENIVEKIDKKGMKSLINESFIFDDENKIESEPEITYNNDPYYSWNYGFGKFSSYVDLSDKTTEEIRKEGVEQEIEQKNVKDMMDYLSSHERMKVEAMKRAEEAIKKGLAGRRIKTEDFNPNPYNAEIYIKASNISPDQLYGEDKKQREQINMQKRCAASAKSFRNIDPCSKINEEEINFLNSIKNIK